jgi:hypothetical protein
VERVFFHYDYRFIQKSIQLLGYIGLIAHPVFYVLLRFVFGYWESFGFRMASSLVYGVLVFIRKTRR